MRANRISRRSFLRAAAVLAAGAGAAALTGCGETNSQPASITPQSWPQGEGTAFPAPEDTFRTPFSGLADLNITANCTDGLYDLLFDDSGSFQRLTWFDYATLQQAVVCSAPNCTHSDENCPAYFGNGFAHSLFRYSEGLLWQEYDDKINAYLLCRMGPDGSGRETVVSLPDDFVNLSIVGACPQGVYLIKGLPVEIVQAGGGYKELVFVDFATGQAQTLDNTLPENARPYENRGGRIWLILASAESGEESFLIYDTATGERQQLTRLGAQMGDILYRTDELQITCWPVDGSPEQPTYQCTLQPPPGEERTCFHVYCICEGHALIQFYGADSQGNLPGGFLFDIYTADLTTGQVAMMPHTYTYADENWPPQFFRQTPAGIFGYGRILPMRKQQISEDGTVWADEAGFTPIYCLIDPHSAVSGQWEMREFTPIG